MNRIIDFIISGFAHVNEYSLSGAVSRMTKLCMHMIAYFLYGELVIFLFWVIGFDVLRYFQKFSLLLIPLSIAIAITTLCVRRISDLTFAENAAVKMTGTPFRITGGSVTDNKIKLSPTTRWLPSVKKHINDAWSTGINSQIGTSTGGNQNVR